MTQWIIGGIVALALIAGGVMFSGSGAKDSMEKEAMMEGTMKKEESMKSETMMKDEAMKKDAMDDAMMKDEMMKDEGTMMNDEGAMMQKGVYEAYAPAKLAKANEGDVVLFFRASWCPTCRALDNDIKANMSKIPAGVTILDVNYDTETALKQKYGVTYQHTLVQVDAQGNLITKWSGGLALSDLVSKIQ